jgi:hypothetical protein
MYERLFMVGPPFETSLTFIDVKGKNLSTIFLKNSFDDDRKIEVTHTTIRVDGCGEVACDPMLRIAVVIAVVVVRGEGAVVVSMLDAVGTGAVVGGALTVAVTLWSVSLVEVVGRMPLRIPLACLPPARLRLPFPLSYPPPARSAPVHHG